jgi:hypothetical protein
MIEEKSKYLDVVIPDVHGHTYGAGFWSAEIILEMGKHYNLTGCDNCPKRPIYDPKYDVGIDKNISEITSVDDSKWYCWLRLPIPSNIFALRAIKRQQGDPDFFIGQAAELNNLHPTELPMMHALRYTPSGPLSFAGMKIPLGTNFHVWAEPAFEAPPAHVSEGFGRLVDMLKGLDLDINSSFEQTISQYDVNCDYTDVATTERKSLYDRYRVLSGTCKHKDQPDKASDDTCGRIQTVTKIRNCIQIVIKHVSV